MASYPCYLRGPIASSLRKRTWQPDRVRGWVVGELDRRPRRRSAGHAGRPAGAERRRRSGCAGDAMAHGSGSTTRRSRSSARRWLPCLVSCRVD